MKRILVLGAGNIGSLIAFLLANTDDYQVFLTDLALSNRPDLERIVNNNDHLSLANLDATDEDALDQFLKTNKIDALVPCLPYYFNIAIAKVARANNVHYFDLTEDTYTTANVLAIANGADCAFVPQCGLAPGFISIVANDLMKNFPQLDTVKMRVGALPVNISNELQYSLTWSTDGLINEYGNLCHALKAGKEIEVMPLEDLENIKVDGLTYEAFNTSGGIGSLAETYATKVQNMSYKTIRYPGHCAKIKFLMNDLKLNYDRETLKRILEHAVPKTYQDVVLVYVSVTGIQDQHFIEENYVKKFYPKTINSIKWSAIQLTTASALCGILDQVLQHPEKYKGHVKQEQFTLAELTSNRFGAYYA